MRSLSGVLCGLLIAGFSLASLAQSEVPVAAESSDGYSTAGLTAEQEAHYRDLIHQLRCLVCQNQTIADSDAPLAQDLRDQVHRQLQQGRSDAEIKDYLTSRYGDFVLYKPPMKRSTFVLWVGPFLLLALALALALRHMRRTRPAAATPAPADPGALKRLLDEES